MEFLKLFWSFSVVVSLLCDSAGYPRLPVIYNYDGFVQVILHQSIHPCPPVVIMLFDAIELQRSGENAFNIFDSRMWYITQRCWGSGSSGSLRALNQIFWWWVTEPWKCLLADELSEELNKAMTLMTEQGVWAQTTRTSIKSNWSRFASKRCILP